jgi:predicted NBD/HSP70 family sugar kinase
MANEIDTRPSVAAMQLLQHLRDGKPRTRGKLAEMLGVARSTAGIRVDELISVGIVEERSEAIYTGGRPSTRVSLAPRSRLVLAADIGATHAHVALVDLLGNILGEVSRALEPSDEPESVLKWVSDTSGDLTTTIGVPPSVVGAAGIGLAAPIEHSTGRPFNPPIMPLWRDFDVQSWLTSILKVPVQVEKDVNMMALGEFRASNPKSENLLFAKIATGIGGGVISGGRLHRGEQGTAGDIGHIPVSRQPDIPCHCGNRGCLEAVASGPALASRLREMGVEAHTSQDVVDLVRNGNLDAIQLIRQAGRDLGEVLATCVSLFNPSSIVVGGTLAAAGEHLLAGVREMVYARSMPLATQHLVIAQADPTAHPALRGAADLAIDSILKVHH